MKNIAITEVPDPQHINEVFAVNTLVDGLSDERITGLPIGNGLLLLNCCKALGLYIQTVQKERADNKIKEEAKTKEIVKVMDKPEPEVQDAK